MSGQALNIWFAICGLTGSLAGIGKTLDDFDRPQEIEKALLVCFELQAKYKDTLLTFTCVLVVVARSIGLRLGSDDRETVYCNVAPSDRRSTA